MTEVHRHKKYIEHWEDSRKTKHGSVMVAGSRGASVGNNRPSDGAES
jgi:hypothetical protein